MSAVATHHIEISFTKKCSKKTQSLTFLCHEARQGLSLLLSDLYHQDRLCVVLPPALPATNTHTCLVVKSCYITHKKFSLYTIRYIIQWEHGIKRQQAVQLLGGCKYTEPQCTVLLLGRITCILQMQSIPIDGLALSECLSVCWADWWPLQNSWTYQDVIWDATSFVLRKHVLERGPDATMERGTLQGDVLVHAQACQAADVLKVTNEVAACSDEACRHHYWSNLI